jgi:transposase
LYNGSERAIRNFKIKQKISGFFKSIEGARGYAAIRSIIDTAIKNDQNPLKILNLIAQC